MLNQKGVRSLNFKVKEAVENNETDLSWESIPENAKAFLLEQRNQLTMTLNDWGIVDENNEINGGKTLMSLVPKYKKTSLIDVVALMEQLSFDMPLNEFALLRHDDSKKRFEKMGESAKRNGKMRQRPRQRRHKTQNPVTLVERFISNLFVHTTENQRKIIKRILINAKKTLAEAKIIQKNH